MASVVNDTYDSMNIVEYVNDGYLQPDNVLKMNALAYKSESTGDSPSFQSQGQLRYNTNNAMYPDPNAGDPDPKSWGRSVRPESMNHGKIHEYEELPTARFSPNDYLTTSECPVFDKQTGVPPQGVDISTQRRRINPLYDASKSCESKRSEDSMISRTSSTPSSLSVYVWIGLLLVISVVALIIAALGLWTNGISQNTTTDAPSSDVMRTVQDLVSKVQELQNDNQRLRLQVDSLMSRNEDTLTNDSMPWQQSLSNYSEYLSSLRAQLTTMASTVQVQGANMADQLSQLRTNLSDQINAVMKMAGPPGPPGAGNLSQCSYMFVDFAESANTAETMSSLNTSDSRMRQLVVTGVTCSTVGGTLALLSVVDAANPVYRCSCTGRSNSAITRRCIIYYWVCPRVS